MAPQSMPWEDAMPDSGAKTTLVLGVTGSCGREVARALQGRGWKIKALHRDPAVAEKSVCPGAGISWIQGDAMSRDDVIHAARGASLIVHAVNPPKYHDWPGLALPMLDSTIAAARTSGARVVFPGTLYNFGPDAGTLLHEESPQCPLTKKGRVRVEMEARLRRAAEQGVRTLIVRAGDFYGPGARNSWLTQGLVKPSGNPRLVWYPQPWEVGHTWTYLPDFAETIAQLIERQASLADFEVFHFRGHWFERGVELAEMICRLKAIHTGRIKAFPWWAVKLGSPFNEAFRETLEMRYLWQTPLQFDNTKLCAKLGQEPMTPIEAALTATLT
jgi:nucleoside-diphosphate-sugar epimerase